MALFLAIMLINLASAFEFDNSKIYNPEDRSNTVRNTFLGLIDVGDVAKVTPITPHNVNVIQGKDRLVAEFDIDSYVKYTEGVWDGMKFYNLKNGNSEIEREFKIKILKSIEEIRIPQYEYICTGTGEFETNGTEITTCKEEYKGDAITENKIWEEIDYSKDLEAGKVTIGIFTDVEAGDYVEFVPTWFNLEMPEYSTWTESFNVGLTHYWNFDETSGTNAKDYGGLLYGSQYNVTLRGDARFDTGKIGKAVYFDGVGDNATSPTGLTVGLPSGTGDWTISLWVMPNESATGLLYCDPDDSLRMINTVTKYARFFGWGGDTGNEVAFPLQDGTHWYHTVLVHQSGRLLMYINGTLKDNVTATTSETANAFILGSDGNGGVDDLNGSIDELGIWNRSLSGVEVLDLYNSDFGISPASASSPPLEITPSLTAPPDYYNTTDTTISFNSTATVSAGTIYNATLYINGVLSNSTTFTLNENQSAGTNLTAGLTDGTYNWSYMYCGSNTTTTLCPFTANRTLTIDTTPPNLEIINPINGNTYNDFILLNISASDTHLNSTWYNLNDGTNITYTTELNISGSHGSNTLNVWANDTFGNLNYTSLTYTLFKINSTLLTPLNGSVQYNSTVIFTGNTSSLGENITNATLYDNMGGWGERFLFNEGRIYDSLDELNASNWTSTQDAPECTAVVTDNRIIQNCALPTGFGTKFGSIVSTNLTDWENIQYLNFSYNVIDDGANGIGYSNVSIFGNVIFNTQDQDIAERIIEVIRNASKFDVYVDGAYNTQITPINDAIGFYSGRIGAGAADQYSMINASIITYNTTYFNQPNPVITGSRNYSSGEEVIWNILLCDTYGECAFSENNFTFTMESTAPTINVTYPSGTISYAYQGQNTTINYSATDTNINTCWYEYGGANITVPCGSNSSIILTSNNSLIFWANDTLNNVNSQNRNWTYAIFENWRSYNATIAETNYGDFFINFTTAASGIPIVYLEYNGVDYLSTLSSGAGTIHQAYNQIPLVTNGEISFRWRIVFNGTTYTYYSSHNVTNLTSMTFVDGETCPAGISKVMNFSFANEQNLTALTGMNVKYNFMYGIVNASAAVYGYLNNTSSFSVCINTTESETYNIGYGEIEYSREDFVSRKYYLFENTRVSNVTTYTILYDLDNADATSFLIEVRKTTLVPYKDKYVTLLRWYTDLNEYKVVEMGRTDDKGQTVLKVKVEDVDYRIGVYEKNGTLINLINPIRMVCLTSPCSYTITIVESTASNFDEEIGVETNLSWNNGTFTLIYNDPSQKTTNMELRVYQLSGTGGESMICNSNSTAFTGVIICDVTGYSGLLKATAVRTASPWREIAMLIIDTATTMFQGTFGLFLQFLISVTLVFLGIVSPVTAIILGIISLAFGAFLFKTITYPIFIGIAILGGIVIHFMRRSVATQ